MRPEVADALAGLVGPLVAQGLQLGIAEGVGKLRAYEAGTYAGEACDRCGTVQALLMPWGATREFPGEPRQMLCEECSRREALWRQSEETRMRVEREAARADQDARIVP